MDYFNYHQRVNYIVEMTNKGRFTSLEQLASKFECSKSTIKRMLSHIRAYGIEITYNREAKKFTIKK